MKKTYLTPETELLLLAETENLMEVSEITVDDGGSDVNLNDDIISKDIPAEMRMMFNAFE